MAYRIKQESWLHNEIGFLSCTSSFEICCGCFLCRFLRIFFLQCQQVSFADVLPILFVMLLCGVYIWLCMDILNSISMYEYIAFV